MTHTTIQWASPFSTGRVLAAAALAMIAFALLRRFGGAPIATPGRRWLRAIRALILGALAVVVLNPVRVDESPGAVERPRVTYLVDASQSMALGKSRGSRWEQAAATIREADRLGKGALGPQVSVFRFGSRLEAVDPSAKTTPNDTDSLLGGSLEALAGRFGQVPPRAVVVFSDGRARDPERAEAVARGYQRMNVPVHVVPVGDGDVGGDVAVVSMVVPPTVRKSTRVAAQVFVRSYGYRGRRAELTLSAVGADGRPGLTLARTPIVLKDGLSQDTLTFESGDQDRRIAATVGPQPGEVSAENNTFAADVAIDHTKIRVLYLEGSADRFVAPRTQPGAGGAEVRGAYSSLQTALMEDPDVECTAVMPAGLGGVFTTFAPGDERNRGLPETASELYAYDAIILSNVPRNALSDQHLLWIDDWIGRRGGGLCMVGGPNSFGSGRWAGTTVGAMLPVEVRPDGGDWDAAPAAVRPLVSGAVHPVWHIAADDDRNRSLLKTMPNFLGHNRLGGVKPSADVLATIGTGPEPAPAVAVQPFGRGRTMAMATAITRRWAGEFTQSWGEGDARYYKKFWRNAVYWLTENSSVGRRRLLAETDRRLYRPGEAILLRARAFDENAAPTLDYRVTVSFEPKSAADGTSENSPLRRPSSGPATAAGAGPLLPWGEEIDLGKLAAESAYSAAFPIAEAQTQGLRIELTAYEGNTQVDSTALDVQVLDDPAEQRNPLPDHALLTRVASASGGLVLSGPGELASMLGKLPVSVGAPEVKKSPAWSRWWLLATLLTLLTVEWALRRRAGLA